MCDPDVTGQTAGGDPDDCFVNFEEIVRERGPASASTETIVEAHMSGEIFLQEGPGKSPFVKIGGQVSVGHQLCIILCMKMSNQVSSPVDGTVAECLVTDEQVVDKGAPLFRITHG